MNKSKSIFNPVIWLVASLTLGLAPFKPEPHIWEKLKWIVNDISQLKPIDWFDVLLHGSPWIMLLVSLVLILKNKD